MLLTSDELESIIGDCNNADGLNPGEIVTTGEGTVEFLKNAPKGLMFSISSLGGLNPVLSANLSPRPDLCPVD